MDINFFHWLENLILSVTNTTRAFLKTYILLFAHPQKLKEKNKKTQLYTKIGPRSFFVLNILASMVLIVLLYGLEMTSLNKDSGGEYFSQVKSFLFDYGNSLFDPKTWLVFCFSFVPVFIGFELLSNVFGFFLKKKSEIYFNAFLYSVSSFVFLQCIWLFIILLLIEFVPTNYYAYLNIYLYVSYLFITITSATVFKSLTDEYDSNKPFLVQLYRTVIPSGNLPQKIKFYTSNDLFFIVLGALAFSCLGLFAVPSIYKNQMDGEIIENTVYFYSDEPSYGKVHFKFCLMVENNSGKSELLHKGNWEMNIEQETHKDKPYLVGLGVADWSLGEKISCCLEDKSSGWVMLQGQIDKTSLADDVMVEKHKVTVIPKAWPFAQIKPFQNLNFVEVEEPEFNNIWQLWELHVGNP